MQESLPSPSRIQRRCFSQRETRQTIPMVSSTTVRWRRPAASSARFDGAKRVRKGSAQGRVPHGTGTNNAMQIHSSPKQVTTVLSEERTASRDIPFARMRAPLRRSSVSSTATTIGTCAGNIPSNRPSRIRAPWRDDQRARFSTR